MLVAATLSLVGAAVQLCLANEYTWRWTNWDDCEDKNACDWITYRYCEGDPTGRLCGKEPNFQSVYTRYLTGCPSLPTYCKSWTTILQTSCNDNGKLEQIFML